MISGYVKIYHMRRSLRNFNIPLWANPAYLTITCKGAVGNLTFAMRQRRVGNLSCECQVKLVFKVCLGISSGANLWFADMLYSFEA